MAAMHGGGSAVARLLGAPGPRLGQAMADALPGVRVLERDLGEAGAGAPATRAVALPNGARIAAEDSRSPLVSAGLFAAGGAALGGPGAAIFEGLAFRSGTLSRCGLRPLPRRPPPPHPPPRSAPLQSRALQGETPNPNWDPRRAELEGLLRRAPLPRSEPLASVIGGGVGPIGPADHFPTVPPARKSPSRPTPQLPPAPPPSGPLGP